MISSTIRIESLMYLKCIGKCRFKCRNNENLVVKHKKSINFGIEY